MASKFNSSLTQFSARFVNELDKDRSVVSSPLSAKIVLALVALGSTGQGHDQLLSAFGLADDEEIRAAFTNVSSKLKSINGVTLKVANKAYVMEGAYDLHPSLKKDAIKVFDSDFEKVNFNDGTAAAELINSWVENQTNNKIKDLLSADAFDSFTRLVLVNAIYFKGTWSNKFNANNTRNRPFYGLDQEIEVPMMYKEDKYKYTESEDLNAQLLELPYVGNEASMLVILPREVDGLNGLLETLADGYDLNSELDRMYPVKVQVSIPKFKIETEIDLKPVLNKLGITKIFDHNDSGLTKILNTDEVLYVSKAVQKAFIEVNEEGAEAAAATAMSFMMCSAMISPDPIKEFIADRPFLVTILVGRDQYFSAIYRGD